MSYLLDTHVLLWWFDDPSLLTKNARSIIEDTANIVFVSSVITWEIAIKKSLGKLRTPDCIYELIYECEFQELSISINHTQAFASIPLYHNDPFDRLLIAQAKIENSIILTRDPMIKKYDVRTIQA